MIQKESFMGPMGVIMKLSFVTVTFTTLTLLVVQNSLTNNAMGLNSESVSSSSDTSVIDYDCTIVNIAFAERDNQKNIEWTIMQSQIHNQHEPLEEEIRISAAARISLLFNNSDSKNFQQELRRPILQKSRKNCFQAILVQANSLEAEQLNLNLKLLKENIISVNQDPILIPNQDKLLVLAGSWELLHSTFKSSFGLSFKYKAGLILSDPSLIYYSHCKYCEKSEQTFALLSSRELWTDYESNMNNYPLKVTASIGAKIRFDYTLIDGSSSLYRPTTGSYVPCISFLQQKLNFTYTIRPIASTGIEYPNGTWTGQVNEILSGNADFATCVGQTFRRHTVAEFSPTVFYEPIALITGHPNKEFVWYAIFWPLSPTVWAMIGVSSSLSVLVIFFLVKNHRDSIIKTTDKPFTWKMDKTMEYIGQSFLGQFDALPPQSQEIPPKIRIFLIVWLFFSFLVSTFYLSILVGFLTFPVYEKIPETGEELAANPDFKVGITYIGGAFSTFLRTSKSPMMMSLANRMELNSGFDCIRSTISEKKVCLGYEIIAQAFINTEGLLSPEGKFQKPPVQIHKQYLLSFSAGFLMEKRSVIVPNFSATVNAALSAGFVAEWERQDLRNKRLQTISNVKNNLDKKPSSREKSVEEEGGSLLTFKHLKGAFLILLGGLTLSSVCMTLEFFSWGWKERQKLRFKSVAAATILAERIRKIRMHEIRT
jgi:hypothetical protein